MKKVLTLILLLTTGLAVKAQTSYDIDTIPYNPDPFTAGSQLTLGDDQFSPVILLPFSFCFFDSVFNSVLIGSNGFLSFNLASSGGYCIWPISAPAPGGGAPGWSIMGPWQDLFPPAGGTIKWDVAGIAPYRRFIVSYHQIQMFACSGMLFSQQIILYETTNVIEFHILNKPVCSAWNNGGAIQGIMRDVTRYTIVAGRNYPTQWTAVNDGIRFSPVGGPCVGPAPVNSVAGRVYSDNNLNCIFDAGDLPVPNRPVIANGGAYYDWTDAAGNYEMALDTGTWHITSSPPLYWGPQCPASGSYTHIFSTGGNNVIADDFADSILVHCPDLVVDIGTLNMTRCLTEVLHVNYCNQGTEPDTAVTITVTLNDSISIDTASIPFTSLGGNQYEFSIGTLSPLQCGSFTINVSIGCDTVGTVYCVGAEIGGSFAECDTTNNEGMDCHALIASVDPNDKYVASQQFSSMGWLHEEMIHSTDELSYRVNFQNTGSDTAVTVRIMDTLSTALDPTTLVPGASSHFYQWVVIGNVLIVEFPAIMLPDSNVNEPASHGFIKFRVKQVNGNVDGTHIYNTAAIYFDQNAPVITGTTDNLVCDGQPVAANGILVSPANYCAGDQVTLTVDGGNAGTAGEWLWSEGACNGASLGNGNSIVTTVTGATTIYVYASSICGETECVMVPLTPQPEETAAFTFTTSNGTATFTDGSSNATSWAWDFGDQNNSSQQNPVHTYTSSGTYTVTLIVTGPCGSDTSTQSVTVLITDAAAAFAGALRVYPNPNAGAFRVDVPALAGRVQIEVSDLSGRVIHQQSGEGLTEVVVNAGKGYYLLTVRGGEWSHTLPVVVE